MNRLIAAHAPAAGATRLTISNGDDALELAL